MTSRPLIVSGRARGAAKDSQAALTFRTFKPTVADPLPTWVLSAERWAADTRTGRPEVRSLVLGVRLRGTLMCLAGVSVGLISVFFRGGVIALLMMLGGRPMGLGSSFVMLGGFVVLGLGHDLSSVTYVALEPLPFELSRPR